MATTSLATKYRPKDWDSVTEQGLPVKILRKMCEEPDLPCRNFLLIGPAGTGKAQPLTSQVFTESGFKQMKDIKVGETVFTRTGHLTTVDGVYPQGSLQTYTICLDDFTAIRVAATHNNIIITKDKDGNFRYDKMTTDKLLREMKDNPEKDFYVPTPKAYDGPLKAHENIDIFLASFLILCGKVDVRENGQYSLYVKINSDFVDNVIRNHLYSCKMRMIYNPDAPIEHKLVGDTLYNYEKFCEKYEDFIDTNSGRFCLPDDIILWSLEDRKDLFDNILMIQGFKNIDITEKDGTYKRGIRTEFKFNHNGALLNSFKRLCQSLGYSIYKETSDERLIYTIVTSTNDTNIVYRKILSVQYDGIEPCQCIHVKDSDHTYLSDNFIPTCNTTIARIASSTINEGSGEIIELDAASHGSVDDLRSLVNEAAIYPVGQKYKTFIIDECFTKGSKVSTPYGDLNIENIQIGDEVFTERGRAKVKKVHKVQVHRSHIIRLIFSDGTKIYTTKDHLFLTEDGWVEAQNLKVCDHLYTLNANIINIDEPYTVEEDLRFKIRAKLEGNTVHLKSRHVIYKKNENDRYGWMTEKEESFVHNHLTSTVMLCESKVCPDDIELPKDVFDIVEDNHEYVWMWDLEIDGHPSYFVNGIACQNCHSASPAAWQTLLKPIEEPLAKSVFFFATTNPEKIPATILSRVQTFQLSKISLEGIENRLKYVIEEENKTGRGITYTNDAINFLAKTANGGMRDALTLLDKALAYSLDITSQNLEKALNLPNYDDFFELLSAYAKKDNQKIVEVLNRVYNSGVNYLKFMEGFYSFVMNIVKFIYMKSISDTMIPSHYADKLSKYSDKHAQICLILGRKLVDLNNELRYSSFPLELSYTTLLQSK